MRALHPRWTVLACALAWTGASIAVGQIPFQFEDDFDRDVWENAQTNAFLPAWSAPTGTYIPPFGVAETNQFNAEVRVAGQNITILVNGQPRVAFSDPDLQVGTVGVMAWGQRAAGSGMECRSLVVEDDEGTVLLNHGWGAAVADWRSIRMPNAAGIPFGDPGPAGERNDGMGVDPITGGVRDASNGYTQATQSLVWLPHVDFTGPAVAYDMPGSENWTDYEVRTRIWCQDNDGVGILLRIQDDQTFYRITFLNEFMGSPPIAWRAPQGVSVQRCRKGVWKEVFRDNQAAPLFAYSVRTAFDVSAKIRTEGETVKLDIAIVNDPGGANQLITIPTITDGPAEPLYIDVDGDGEFDPEDGDRFSVNDLNNNGRWDPAENMVTDVNGNRVFEPAEGDRFSNNDTNNNGQWDPGEPLATDVDGDGVFDPEDGDVFDTRDTNRNGRWDPAEPMDFDVDGDNLLEPADGDVFDANDIYPGGYWDGAPIPSGQAGLHSWGNFAVTTSPPPSSPAGVLYTSYGGSSTEFVRTLEGTPLTGDPFQPFGDWVGGPYAGGQVAGCGPTWTIRARDGVLIENSDGRLVDGSGGNGAYQPYYIVKGGGFSTGPNYTVKAVLHNIDDDGLGLIFGYVDSNNYFRVGWRSQGTGAFGFAQGTTVQKIVNGQITQLVAVIPPRANQAGIWVKKLGTGALEQSDPGDRMPDGQRNPGVEFQGPRLVAGDAGWTDYTFETEIEAADQDGIGVLFRYQDEENHYRLVFQSRAHPFAGAPAPGFTLQRVAGGVYTELLRETDLTKPGDNNSDPSAGFIYVAQQIWRTRVILDGDVIRIEIDALGQNNFYTATVTDAGTPLTQGKIGLFTWGHGGNEFRNLKVTLEGQTEPVFVEGIGAPDPMGWIDASIPTLMGNMSNSTAVAGAPISGFGIRVDLDALGVRDNSYRSGGNWIAPGNPPNYSRGTTDFDGPRAVVGKATWKDYTYTVDLRSLDDDGLGIVFRYIDENNFYRLMFMSQSGNTLGPPPRGISVQKRLDGAYSEVFYNGTSFIYTPGQRWRTQLTATGSHFDIQVTELDGPAAGTVHNFSFDDPVDPILRGKVGVTAWGAHAAANEDNALLGGLDWTQNFFEGAVFDNVLVVGTMTRVVPDLNDDQFVNADDLILWGPCVTGPGIPAVNPTEACQKADVDGDGDVDQDDFGYFQRCFTGSLDIPVDETCVD